jgi:hypothetical protein
MDKKLREDKKCPKCGKGFMKVFHKTTSLDEAKRLGGEEIPMQAMCTNPECKHTDDYTKFYPLGAK